MKTVLMAVALAGMLGSGAAMAENVRLDGNGLLRQCQQFIKMMDGEKDFNRLDAGTCGGFVQGVSSTVFFFRGELKKDDKFCEPDTATGNQLVRIVVKYLKDNPKMLNEGRTTLVWLALMDAYPCK
ncbi:hypothetical protein D3C76_1375580 [compost metagenome]|uniref:Rap1a/Tai family immunity protein n=1 Tax=Pseudomonas fluorescens TaxID=294 RepID=UPI000F999EB7|nr:Rap1a/Tai family immunity protein [Pseudomonas fluorescens]